MKISTKGRYGLRAFIDLACYGAEEPVSISSISARQEISERYLEQLMEMCIRDRCGTILNPGSVVGPHTNIYPLSSVRGFVPGGSIYKCAGEVVEMRQE